MAEQPTDELRGEMERLSKRFQGIRVAARKVVSGAEIHLGAQINVADRETPDEAAFPFKLIDGEWRLDGAP
jgi:hypothetical protein